MSKQVKVVLDAMGGDYAPKETVKGAVEALEASKDIHLILTGKEDEIKKELENYPNYDKNRLEIINATEVIGFNGLTS